MMLHKFLAVVTIVIMLCTSLVFGVYGDNSMPISIYVNEKEICTDSNAYIENGTTYVPVRAICNAMGVKDIEWNDSHKKATVKGYSKLEFYIGKSYAYVNGEKKQMPVKAVLKNGRTMVPVRFFAENSDAQVKWDDTLHSVKITKDGVNVPSKYCANSYSADDILWLSRIVHAESAGEPVNGQIAVANVVLNRVKDINYPNTIYGVIFDRNYGIQFQPVANGTIYNNPSKKSVYAAKRAANGESYAGESLYFLNEKIATNFWIVNNRKYYTTINNHSFYL
ncbi:MAG: cell wall hydrolase [Clostridia bacterium]|nr:cell wall hydrolase [Clostridia bacterium]